MPHATIAPARKHRVRRPALDRAGAGAGAVRPTPAYAYASAAAPALAAAPAPARSVLPLWQALLPGGAATTAGARP
ncbi:hypothetical protein ACWD3Z_38205 [Streptomyces sp. NPDC002740]